MHYLDASREKLLHGIKSQTSEKEKWLSIKSWHDYKMNPHKYTQTIFILYVQPVLNHFSFIYNAFICWLKFLQSLNMRSEQRMSRENFVKWIKWNLLDRFWWKHPTNCVCHLSIGGLNGRAASRPAWTACLNCSLFRCICAKEKKNIKKISIETC